MINYKLVKNASFSLIISASIFLSGCAKDVPCPIKTKHIHIYEDNTDNLTRYIIGEKDHQGMFTRTNHYVPDTTENELIANNNLYLLSSNYEYVYNLYEKYTDHIEEYKEVTINGPYLNIYKDTSSNKYKFEIANGSHLTHEWMTIDSGIATSNPIRNVTYSLRIYSIKDGYLDYKLFKNFSDIESDYKYFQIQNVIEKEYSETYYSNKTLKKSK